MVNRNLADEVDALAKGLASLRARISGLSRRVAALEDRELRALALKTAPIKIPAKTFQNFQQSVRAFRAWWAR